MFRGNIDFSCGLSLDPTLVLALGRRTLLPKEPDLRNPRVKASPEDHAKWDALH